MSISKQAYHRLQAHITKVYLKTAQHLNAGTVFNELILEHLPVVPGETDLTAEIDEELLAVQTIKAGKRVAPIPASKAKAG